MIRRFGCQDGGLRLRLNPPTSCFFSPPSARVARGGEGWGGGCFGILIGRRTRGETPQPPTPPHRFAEGGGKRSGNGDRNDERWRDAKCMPDQHNLPVVPMCRRSLALRCRANQNDALACLVSAKRGGSRSSRTLGAGCDGRKALKRNHCADEQRICGRRSRVVLALRCRRQGREDASSVSRATVATKHGHRGEHEGNR
jgi:hypothetical protein